jgi:hypothetical protein
VVVGHDQDRATAARARFLQKNLRGIVHGSEDARPAACPLQDILLDRFFDRCQILRKPREQARASGESHDGYAISRAQLRQRDMRGRRHAFQLGLHAAAHVEQQDDVDGFFLLRKVEDLLGHAVIEEFETILW